MRRRRSARRRWRTAPVLGEYEATVRAWLVGDAGAPRKQRHTARRVWQRLMDEEGAEVAESSVRALVARLRGEIGTGRPLVSVPQTHAVGAEAEVDFGEFTAVIAGVMTMTLGTFLWALPFGHVRQVGAVASRLLAVLVTVAPILRDAAQMAYVDVDDTVRAAHGYSKQGAGFGTPVCGA